MNHPTSTRTLCSSMPATWAGSCAVDLKGHCTARGNAHLFPTRQLSGTQQHEPDQTVRALQAWPDYAAQPPRDGAIDPQPRDTARHGAEPAGGGLLRATRLGGMLSTEASQVSQQGQGYQDTPGIYSKEQVAGWRKVTDRVHERGGRIFIQIWHVGRISHTSLQPNDGAPVAPSAIRAKGKTFVGGTFTDISEPRALALEEIPGIIESFRRGTANALAAGFDGVEIHGANGYLLDQFAKDGTNKRTDAYGGSIENRAKLMLEVSRVVAAEAGPERTGIRISPGTPANDVSDSHPQPLFDYIVDHLNALKLVYIHVVEGATGGPRDIAPFDYGSLRKRFKGAYVANNGYDFELATKVLAANEADLIAFGKPFISNPDLVERLKKGAPLNEWDKATFYGGSAKGYTDYPTLEAAEAAQ